jgi:hypothetical protein
MLTHQKVSQQFELALAEAPDQRLLTPASRVEITGLLKLLLNTCTTSAATDGETDEQDHS